MFEPKVLDHLTINGSHILIYEHLDFPITIMLANDIVVGINPEADEVSLLIPNKDKVYDYITTIQTTKPTFGCVEVDLTTHFLKSSKKFSKGNFVDQKFYVKDSFSNFIFDYYKR